MPVVLSSLIDAPAEELAGAFACDESRCCLRDWLALVPDPRSRLGRRHLLEFVLGLAVCAFTAAGHDSPQAVAEWAAGCLPETLAVLGGRRDPWTRRIRPPSARTFARVFERIDAEAFNAALYGYLAALPADPPDALPAVTRHEREQRRAARAAASPGLPGLLGQAAADGKTVRGAVRPDGSQVHLLSLFDVTTGCVRAQREIAAKTNEIPELAPAIAHLDLIGTVVTADALHTQAETARYLAEEEKAHYLMIVEHASHCSCCLSWRVKQSSLAASDLDTQAFAASLGEVDGVELAALDLVQHGLAGDAEVAGGLAEGQPAVGCLGPDAVAELLVDADLPGCSGSELLAGDEAVAQPPVDGGAGDAELAGGFADADHGCIIAAGCDIFGRRLVSGDAVVGA
jgi:hypothetical protein